MRRILKICAWSLAALLALAVLLIGAVWIIGSTDRGRALIVRLTPELTGGHVRLAGISGSFPAALDLERLELSDERGVWLFAEHISLRWSPLALLGRHVQVDTLHIARLHVERAPLPEKEKKPASTPSIPHTDLRDLSIDALELGPELAGSAVSLVVHASAHLRSLQDATAKLSAQRTGGLGDYELQVQFDPRRIDAAVKVQEPASGPLENILKIPGLGDLSVLARLNGPRNAGHIQLTLDAGSLHGRAQGMVNLTDTSADLQYSLTADRMSPRPGLTWQSIDLHGRWRGTIKLPSADAHLEAKELQIPGGTQFAGLTADLAANSTGLLTVRAAVEGLVVPGPQPMLLRDAPLTVEGSVHMNDEQRPVDIDARHRLFTLHAHVITAGEQSGQLELRIPDVAPFAALGGENIKGDATIKAQVKYSAASTRLSADANGNINGGAAAWAGLLRGGTTRLQLAGTLTDRTITVERLQLSGSAIAFSATGSAERSDSTASAERFDSTASAERTRDTAASSGIRKLDARLELSLPDLSKVAPAATGTLKLTGKVSGPLQSLSAVTDLTSTLSVHGSPMGTVSATVRAEGLPKAPRGTVEARGDLDGAPLVLNVAVERPNGASAQASSDLIHVIFQHADWKSAHIEGDLRSGADVSRAQGTLRIRMTQLGDLDRLLASKLQGSVSGNLTLTPAAGHSRAELQVDAQDIVAGGLTTNAQLSANGVLDALNLRFAAQSPAVAGEPASVSSSAQLNLSARQINLTSAEASYHGQTVRLLSPARVSFGDGFQIDGLRLGAQQAVVEVNGRISPALDVRASVRELKPDLLNAFVPDLLASGTIRADARIEGTPASPTGEIRIDATGLRAKNDAALGLPLTDIHASAELMGNTASVDTKLTAGKASQLALTGHAPLAADGTLDLKLTGNLDVGLLNPMLEAGGRHASGTLAVDTTITGAATSPEIGGKVRLVKGTLRDYTQGTNLSDINGELSGEHGTLRIQKLTARAAPGDVSISGTIGILQPKIPVDLKLTAKNAQPIASNIVTANLDADVHVGGTARERLELEGTIRINRADVEIPGSLPPNVAVLDVRRPGRTSAKAPEQPLIIALNLNIDAERQILVKGRGLDAELGGEIRVRGTTAQPAVSGGFELQRGFFTLASSKLTFSNGRVTFNGAGLNKTLDPTLDFTAQSQAADVTVTVRITGVADAPKIELSSTPDLPQDEIMARLLFGVPAAQLTALQVVQIGAALASLGGGGGFNPVAKIQKALGLDRLSVGSASTPGATGQQNNNGASIEAGRYVSSRIFVSVKETTTGTSQLGVDVDLTKHLKLQTRLGNGTASAQGTTPENDPGSSVGLAYQFEY